jgi:hypothetical protein
MRLIVLTAEGWGKCGRHAQRLQEEDFMKEYSRGSITEPMIMNLTATPTVRVKSSLSETEIMKLTATPTVRV